MKKLRGALVSAVLFSVSYQVFSAGPPGEARRAVEQMVPGAMVVDERIEYAAKSGLTVGVFRVVSPQAGGFGGGSTDTVFTVNNKAVTLKQFAGEMRSVYGWNRPEALSFSQTMIGPETARRVAAHYAKKKFGSANLGEVIVGYGLDRQPEAFLFPVLLTPDAKSDISGISQHVTHLRVTPPDKTTMSIQAKREPGSRAPWEERQARLQAAEGSEFYGTICISARCRRAPFWHSSAAAPDLARNRERATEVAKVRLNGQAVEEIYYHLGPELQFLRFSGNGTFCVVNLISLQAFSAQEWEALGSDYDSRPLVPYDQIARQWSAFGIR